MADEQPGTDIGGTEAKSVGGDDQSVRPKRRFDSRDWAMAAEYIVDELDRRRKARIRDDLERQWREVDRQLRMEPDIRARTENGSNDPANIRPDMKWQPMVELPLQAQTLEVLTSDARRMIFPSEGLWYAGHALLSDEYLDRVDFRGLIAGDENDVPSQINQENADKLAEGLLDHFHRQYDFRGRIDHMNAEAFKYGTLVGRLRLSTKSVVLDTARGAIRRRQTFPILIPRSIKHTYLDDTLQNVENEGLVSGPSIIEATRVRIDDVIMAARKGGNDPRDPDGGWMPAALKVFEIEGKAETDTNGLVDRIVMEGDIIIPRKTTRSIVLENARFTVIRGARSKAVVRFQLNRFPFTSYVWQPYHVEDLTSPYGVGPLMKGMPIQMSATEALNRVLQSAILNTEPPLAYSPDEPQFQARGGPEVAPRALWETETGVTPVEIGDPKALFQVYLGFLQQYADLTGINAPRLGQQTISHTTAFAKEAELQRGTVRTVDYVRSFLDGGLARLLHMEYEMGREAMSRRGMTFWIEEYGGWVTAGKDDLPDQALFEALGSAAPLDEQDRRQQKMGALQLVISVEQLDLQIKQAGVQPGIDLDQIKRVILREGGFVDIDTILATVSGSTQDGAAGPAGVQGAPGLSAANPAQILEAIEGGR